MLKYPVIAAFISNLTDARYFAARGIDFLLYDLDQISIPQVEEIQNWVSGPKALILFSRNTLDLVDEAIIKIVPEAIALKDESIDTLDHLSGHVQFFNWSKDHIQFDNIFFRPFDQHDGTEEMGILLFGGSEVQVGVKSYDALDDILDQIEC